MILGYSYWYFQSALTEEQCDAILELGITRMHENVLKYGEHSIVATTGDFKHKGSPMQPNSDIQVSLENYTAAGLKKKGLTTDDIYLRDSSVVFLHDQWLYELIWPYIRRANELAGWNFEWDFTEEIQFTKYQPNQFYGWHADAGLYAYGKYDETKDEQLKDVNGNLMFDYEGKPVPANSSLVTHPGMIGKIRKLSMTISLSDPKDYKGGNLRFDFGPHADHKRYHTCKEIRPRGSIIIFPSHVYHQVTPVTTGTRYSLVAWSLGQPWK